MASITGYCPVCTEVFSADIRRPHCIPCGHVFCFDCLARMCGSTLGSCPFCRTTFHPEDIRWLFFNYEYEGMSNVAHCASSDSVDSHTVSTVLEWLHEARVDLERRITDMANAAEFSHDELVELLSEVQAWLETYDAAGLPRVPENRALEFASASLTIASSTHERRLAEAHVHAAELRVQLKAMRHEIRILRKKANEIVRVKRDAELKILEKDIEIRALRDLNRLYRHAAGIKGSARRPMERPSEASRVPLRVHRRSAGKKLQPVVEDATLRIERKKAEESFRDIIQGPEKDEGQRVQKSVTWFRTDLRRSGAAGQ